MQRTHSEELRRLSDRLDLVEGENRKLREDNLLMKHELLDKEDAGARREFDSDGERDEVITQQANKINILKNYV
jgi:hypothetical protein